jgi:uncharacterized protein YndB with AHSA1/START domain
VSSQTQSTAEGPDADGNRPPGEGEHGPAVHVSRVVAAPVEDVWKSLITPAGTQALLGDGAMLGSKGESWHSGDGSHGVVRSYHPMEQLRVSWHADDAAPRTLVDLHLEPDGDGTHLDLVHEHLADGVDTQALTARWDGALERLAGTVTG